MEIFWSNFSSLYESRKKGQGFNVKRNFYFISCSFTFLAVRDIIKYSISQPFWIINKRRWCCCCMFFAIHSFYTWVLSFVLLLFSFLWTFVELFSLKVMNLFRRWFSEVCGMLLVGGYDNGRLKRKNRSLMWFRWISMITENLNIFWTRRWILWWNFFSVAW